MGLSAVTRTHMWLQEGESSHHAMCWVGVWWVSIAEQYRTLCPVQTAQEGVGRAHSAADTPESSAGEEWPPVLGIYSQLLLRIYRNTQLLQQAFNFTQFPSHSAYISGAFYASCTKKPHLQKWSENTAPSTRPCSNTTASYFCSYPWGLPKFPPWDHQTQDTQAKAPKGSFHYLGEGEIYCLSASRNLLLPPAFGLLPTSLISNSLKENILTHTPNHVPPTKKKNNQM